MSRIAAIGSISRDTVLLLDSVPGRDDLAVISETITSLGGSTASICVALARLGEEVTFRAAVGSDEHAESLRAALQAEHVHSQMVSTKIGPSDRRTILMENETSAWKTLWDKGAAIAMGDKIDIAAIFGHDVVILDIDDSPLRRFLTDLPAHTRPDVRLIGPLAQLATGTEPDAMEIALRFDSIVGSVADYFTMMNVDTITTLIHELQSSMPGNNLRAAWVSEGPDGCWWITPHEHRHLPACSFDIAGSVGNDSAFIAGVAYGMARRWSEPDTARFANAMSALATRSLDGLSALPTLDEVQESLDEQP